MDAKMHLVRTVEKSVSLTVVPCGSDRALAWLEFQSYECSGPASHVRGAEVECGKSQRPQAHIE
jgi:hypothetical protein